MAVDAHRLNHMLAATARRQPAAPQGLANRAGAAAARSAAAAAPWHGTGRLQVPAAGAAGSSSQQQPLAYMGLGAPRPAPGASSSSGADQYSEFLKLAAVDLVQRGTKLEGPQEMVMGGNKRKRAAPEPEPEPGLGAAELAAFAHGQMIAVDSILLNHAAKMWTGLAEQRHKLMRKIAESVEAKAARELKSKEEEIERARKINWMLDEQLRNVTLESQMWRDLALSNEASANVLRGELQQMLDAQAARGGVRRNDVVDDAGSCCYGENDVRGDQDQDQDQEVTAPVAATGFGMCKGCGAGGAAAVLLLPCRHLCLCASCAAAATACPACGCAKNGSVCVNLS